MYMDACSRWRRIRQDVDKIRMFPYPGRKTSCITDQTIHQHCSPASSLPFPSTCTCCTGYRFNGTAAAPTSTNPRCDSVRSSTLPTLFFW